MDQKEKSYELHYSFRGIQIAYGGGAGNRTRVLQN